MVNRKRVRDPASIAIRSDDQHLAEFAQGVCERDDSRTIDAVVVSDEDTQVATFDFMRPLGRDPEAYSRTCSPAS